MHHRPLCIRWHTLRVGCTGSWEEDVKVVDGEWTDPCGDSLETMCCTKFKCKIHASNDEFWQRTPHFRVFASAEGTYPLYLDTSQAALVCESQYGVCVRHVSVGLFGVSTIDFVPPLCR